MKPDEDLDTMGREHLIAEARRLRAGIRARRDSSGHALAGIIRDSGPATRTIRPAADGPNVAGVSPRLPGYRESLDEQSPDAPRSDAPYRP